MEFSYQLEGSPSHDHVSFKKGKRRAGKVAHWVSACHASTRTCVQILGIHIQLDSSTVIRLLLWWDQRQKQEKPSSQAAHLVHSALIKRPCSVEDEDWHPVLFCDLHTCVVACLYLFTHINTNMHAWQKQYLFSDNFNKQCSSNDNHHTVPYPSELNHSVLHDGMCLQWDVEAGYVVTENLCPLVNISLLPPTLKIWQPDFYEFDILTLYICTCNWYQKAFFSLW